MRAAPTAGSQAGELREVVVLAATRFELAPLLAALGPATPEPGGAWPPRLRLAHGERSLTLVATGLGKANAAAALAAVVASLDSSGGASPDNPPSVLQLGVAGAYPGCDLPLGAVAVAASERDLDLGVGEDRARLGLDAIGFELLPGSGVHNLIALGGDTARAIAAGLGAPLLDFATSDGVTATAAAAEATAARHGVALESMEGFAAAQVALALGLPFVELRAVSNRVGDRDKRNWKLAEAAQAAAAAAHYALGLL